MMQHESKQDLILFALGQRRHLTPEQIRKGTGIQGVGSVLDQLRRKGLVDKDFGKWFRVHHGQA